MRLPFRSMPVFLVLVFVTFSLLATHPVHAESFDIARLMQLLASAPEGEVAYTEKKYSALLTEPVVSSGTLSYRRPDIVEKNMVLPRKESFRIVGEALIVARKGTEKRYPLSSQPLLSAFAASLRGVLGGDVKLLNQHFQLALSGSEQQWQLEMTPTEADITRYVERIFVTGHGSQVEQIEVREGSGDRSVLQVR